METIYLSEAVSPTEGIYRTKGNTATRYFSSEIFKEATIGGEEYIVYLQFNNGQTGYDYVNYVGPSEGLYARVIGQNTIQFSLNNSAGGTFREDNITVVIEKVSNPSEKISINLDIDMSRTEKIVKN